MTVHKGNNYIISGAGTGLGKEISLKLVSEGANLLIFSRTESQIKELGIALRELNPASKVVAIKADISKESDVDNVIDIFTREFNALNGIVSNAGIYGPMGISYKVDWLKWKESIGINFLGCVYLINSSVPLILKTGGGSIVQLSGGGATQPMPYISSYAAGKAAIVRYVESVALELQSYGIRINTVAPGPLNTRLLEQVLETGPEVVGEDFYRKSLSQKSGGGADPEIACELVSFLLSDKSKVITGKLISALWDCWEAWPYNWDAIEKSNAYTLRRISGKDHNFSWETK